MMIDAMTPMQGKHINVKQQATSYRSVRGERVGGHLPRLPLGKVAKHQRNKAINETEFACSTQERGGCFYISYDEANLKKLRPSCHIALQHCLIRPLRPQYHYRLYFDSVMVAIFSYHLLSPSKSTQ